jgi:hypothetical protein
MRNRALLTALTFGLCLTAGAAHAACPTGVYYIDLKSGLAGTIGGATQVSLQSPVVASPTTACGGGWKEAVLKVDLAGCTSARLVAQYEGLPHDWTLNIGDSPTNDGFGGDAGTTDNDAELWINQETMAIATSSPAATIDNPIYRQDLGLTDSGLEFVVKNQFISWGQGYSFLQTPSTKHLFAFPDTAVPAQGSLFYVGLNRVVGTNARRGCGLRRMLVVLQ